MKRWIFLALVVACGKDYQSDDDSGSGGESGASGGSKAGGAGGASTGGKGGSAGSTSSGGKGGKGGSSGMNGTSANGGVSGDTSSTGGSGGKGGAGAGAGGTSGDNATGASGGTSAGEAGVGADGGKGGTSGTGGASGGDSGKGGTAGTGGATGGTSGSSGTAGSAGSTDTACDVDYLVGLDGFVRTPAHNACWHGYAYTGGDSGSTVSPTSFSTCGSGCVLSSSGLVNAATEANAYVGNVFLGFGVNQPAGASTKSALTPTGAGIQISFQITGTNVARLTLQNGSNQWCHELPASGSNLQIPYTTFSKQCWEGGTMTAYAKESIQEVQLIVPGGATTQSFGITLTRLIEY